MDKKSLVNKNIIKGTKLIQHLDSTDFKVASALWLYLSEPSEWRLVLASEYFNLYGPKKAYSFIQNELKRIRPQIGIPLTDISVIGNNDELIKLIRIAITVQTDLSNPIRFTGNVINGTMIEDALIYRIT